MKTIGILAHSAEGGALCFITACREGSKLLGEHNHPEIMVSAIPMHLSMPGWNSDDHTAVAKYLSKGVDQLHRAGADFFVCPDNTAHIVLETIIDQLPLPGMHIADVVCREINKNSWTKAALLGTNWTMTGPVYEAKMAQNGIARIIPEETSRQLVHDTIFSELCNGIFTEQTTQAYIDIIQELKEQGAECVVLGCTEIPLIINQKNSPLPILDSTRLLAKYAVGRAIDSSDLEPGWQSLP